MISGGSQSTTAVGFFSVIEDTELGCVGGYLVLNQNGRPLEFHCTAPVRPNRAQEILFGPTLQPYIYGEQIGPALLAKAKTPVSLLCTDQHAAMTLRGSVDSPLALVRADSDHELTANPVIQLPALCEFEAGDYFLAVLTDHPQDQQEVGQQVESLDPAVDLQEPFERIREAIGEAQSGLRGGK